MVTRNRIKVAEKDVALMWQQLTGQELTASGGEQIGVLYPGRLHGDSGPDFRDAVIIHRARLTQGDVEVHTESGDWYRHGHHLDARYNDTVLHVALWRGSHPDTVLQSGRSIPVLCLAEALRHQAYLMPRPLPCAGTVNRIGREGVMTLLQAAGEERFTQKATRFHNQIVSFVNKEQVGQVLFQGMMRALGYSRNTRPFEELARRTPLSHIESAEGSLKIQALLLGTAGLLPSQRRLQEHAAEREIRDLERAWRSVEQGISVMSYANWSFSHIYPNNSPVRRIIAQSFAIERHCRGARREPPGERLMSGLMRLVDEAPLSGGSHVLESGLTVTGSGYWQDHFDFGASSRTRRAALLGASKAGEIVTNVLLPFAFALGKMVKDRRLMKKVTALYRSYPGHAENEITRHMAGQLQLARFTCTACQQQGLIHVFRNYCREGRCTECPLVRHLDS